MCDVLSHYTPTSSTVSDEWRTCDQLLIYYVEIHTDIEVTMSQEYR